MSQKPVNSASKTDSKAPVESKAAAAPVQTQAATGLPVHLIPVASLPSRKPKHFDLRPNAEDRAAIARELGIEGITAMMMTGQILAAGRADFRMTARLQARTIQACVVTLEPVISQIDETIDRLYQATVDEPQEAEIEIPEDDIEPLPTAIDLTAIAMEALSLGLPPYPRAPGAELGVAVFAEPGIAALRDEDLRPFSALAGLAEKLAKSGKTE